MRIENIIRIRLNNIYYILLISAILGSAVSYGKLYLFHIILLIIIFSYIYLYNGKIKIPKLSTNFHNIFYYFCLWYLITIIWSKNKIYATNYLIYILLGSFLALSIIYYIDNEIKYKKIFKIFCIIFTIDIIVGLLESLTSFRLPVSPFSKYLSYFGRDEKHIYDLDKTLINYLLSMPTGFHWNPNNFAATIIIIFPFILLIRKLIIKYSGVIIALFLIIQTGSRGNIIAFIMEIIMYIIFCSKKKMTVYNAIKKFIIILIVIFIILYGLSFAMQKIGIKNIKINELKNIFIALGQYATGSESGRGSISIRRQLMRNGLEALNSTYGIGVGGGNSMVIQQEKGMKTHSMHNFWIEILVEGGIIFFMIFSICYLVIAYKLYKYSIKLPDNCFYKYMTRSLFLSLIGFIFGAISTSSVIYYFPMYLLLGLSICTINLVKLKYSNVG